ncbi:MAG: regulatory protein RecX [Bacteroidia bacterium]|nr:regulatory protein RecX [Bacteroidia bacterium]
MDREILAKLYKFCAYRDRSRSEIVDKLHSLGVAGPEEDLYLEHLAAERFWDEARFAYQYARGKFNQNGWGRTRIRLELRQREVPAALIASEMASAIPEAEYRAAIRKLAAAKLAQLGDDPQARDKTLRYLLQKGFEWEVLREEVEG